MMSCNGLQEMNSSGKWRVTLGMDLLQLVTCKLRRIELGSFGRYAKSNFLGWLTAVSIITLTILQTSCQTNDESWDRIQESGVLRVGLDPTYPPFETANEEGVYGLDVDLAQAIGDELGLEVQFVYFGYDGLYDALATHQVDVLISALVVVIERTKDFAYSDPYFNAGEILIVPAEDETIETMADLNGRILAVELGSLGHVEAMEWAKRVANLTVRPFATADEAITAVQQGEADAALTDAISGRLFLQQSNGLQQADSLKRLPESITVEPFAFVVRKDDEQLLDVLNKTLEMLGGNGRLDQIETKWLGS
ncbi:MAG: amino acid ABC transporter substrate-binding protein [Chloroflexi bacterium]|nr:amino acid ABC transporter substrate-binding protein [Chloroflexota bacterium]